MAHFVVQLGGCVERLGDFPADDLAESPTQAVNGHSHCAVAQPS
jgi:hypothetical protein